MDKKRNGKRVTIVIVDKERNSEYASIVVAEDFYDRIHALADKNGMTIDEQVTLLLQIGYTVDKKYSEGLNKQVESMSNGQEA